MSRTAELVGEDRDVSWIEVFAAVELEALTALCQGIDCAHAGEPREVAIRRVDGRAMLD